jgi:tyrosyl-tRNA synthetase
MSTSPLQQITLGTAQMLPKEELAKKLTRTTPLIIKFGADPTAADLHLGHAVVLRKLRQFQDLGHTIIFLIGDFTARIGDPTGRSKTRPPLTEQQIEENSKTYLAQVGKIVDMNRCQIVYNSAWLSTLTAQQIITLCAKVTVAQITEREDFAKRLTEKVPVGLHELLYPLLQGYDSVALKADIELGGTDQTFNLLMGRILQEQYGQEPQCILTMPLLEGLDGVQKMSKSLGNTIGLNESAASAYGKLMSISDKLMERYSLLLLYQTINFAHSPKPMNLKKETAYAIIALFWPAQEAQEAQEQFEKLFQQRDLSHAQKLNMAELPATIRVIDFVRIIDSQKSATQLRRLIADGAFEINTTKYTDPVAMVTIQHNDHVKLGKHQFYRITNGLPQ